MKCYVFDSNSHLLPNDVNALPYIDIYFHILVHQSFNTN